MIDESSIQLTELRVEDNPHTISYGSSALEPHMDIPMYESHPGITMIHCLRFVNSYTVQRLHGS